MNTFPANLLRRVAEQETFLLHLQAAGLPMPETELLFAPPRRWRFDYAYPALKIAIEIDGGIWTQGRHTRGSGFVGDCHKLNEAALRGWRVLRFTYSMIEDGSALATIERLLHAEGRCLDA